MENRELAHLAHRRPLAKGLLLGLLLVFCVDGVSRDCRNDHTCAENGDAGRSGELKPVYWIREENQFYLYSRSCPVLTQALESIADHRLRLEGASAETTPISRHLCEKRKVDGVTYFRVLVHPYLTDQVKQLLHQAPPHDGPNCYSAAFAGAGVLSFGGGMLETEALTILQSPLCEKLGVNEPIRTGDVFVVYSSRATHPYPTHMMMALTKSLVFEKPSSDALEKYDVSSRREEFLNYPGADGKAPRQNSKPVKGHWYEVYRCQSAREFLRKTTVGSGEATGLLAELEALSEEVGKASLTKELNEKAYRKGMEHLKELEAKLHSLSPPQVPAWFAKVALARTSSLRRQIQDILAPR